jgi:cell division protein FtsB
MEDSRHIGRIVLLALLLVILLFNKGARTLARRYFELRNLNNKTTLMQKENVYLKHEIYCLENDSSYVEYIARKELGLVSKGELEFRFK